MGKRILHYEEPDRVLVTGATGFIGSAIVRAFLNAGFNVRALVRPSSPRTNLLGLPVEIVEGDLKERPSIAAALRDVRFLIHAAADYRLWTRNPSELMAANVRGTSNVMEEALKSGVEKIVYTSSVCTLGHSPGQDVADETHSLDPAKAFNPYKRSKTLAEDLVRGLVEKAGLPAIIVNPSAPVGPRDIKPTPTGRIIVECGAGRMPAYVDTGLNLVHVDDVAQGHLAALRHGVAGQRYILGGQNIRLRDMLTEIARQTGRRPPSIKLPVPVVLPFAVASECVAWSTGKEPFATRDSLRMARQTMFYNDAKARRELGYTSRPYEEGVADAIAWFYGAGKLARQRVALGRFKLLPR
jgi:dihydroflavonol-4-reductase